MVGSSGCRPRSAPGRPTLVRPVRIGDWPVMKAARPAVQLCWPYQSVKLHPDIFFSLDMMGAKLMSQAGRLVTIAVGVALAIGAGVTAVSQARLPAPPARTRRSG